MVNVDKIFYSLLSFCLFSGSFQSAVSSIETVSSLTGYIGRKQAPAVPATVPKQQTNDKILSSKVTKLQVDLHIKCLLLEVEENERPLFRFQMEDLSARLTKKNYNMIGQFGIGGCQCHQTKFQMPDGSPVALLSTSVSNMSHPDKLLVVDIQKLEEKSPDWAGVHLAISANMSSVDLCLHQDAILDLAKEVDTPPWWVEHLARRHQQGAELRLEDGPTYWMPTGRGQPWMQSPSLR